MAQDLLVDRLPYTVRSPSRGNAAAQATMREWRARREDGIDVHIQARIEDLDLRMDDDR